MTRASALTVLLTAAMAAGCGNPEIDVGAGDATGDADRAADSTSLAGRVGLSVIGLLSPHYDCDAVIRAFGHAPIVFGYLERSFGDDRRCLDRLLDHPHFAAVRVHVFNGPCVRNHRCGDNEVLAGETIDSLDRKLANGDPALVAKMNAELFRVRDLLAPHVRHGKHYDVSGILENDLRDPRAARRVVDLVRAAFGPLGFKVVNSAVSGATRVGEDVSEKHGDHPAVSAPCIADLDGNEVSDFRAWATRYRQCAMVLGWNAEMNCLAQGEPFSDPRSRHHCPTDASLAGFARVIH